MTSANCQAAPPDSLVAVGLQLTDDNGVCLHDVLNEKRVFGTIEELVAFYQTFDTDVPGGLPALLTDCISPPE